MPEGDPTLRMGEAERTVIEEAAAAAFIRIADTEMGRAAMLKAGIAGVDWAIACYHEAETDIRWAKERASAITYWSALLSSAIVVAAEAAALDGFVGALFSILQGGIAVLWLVDLHGFARRARSWVHKALPNAELYPIKQAADPDHKQHLVAQCVIVIAAAIVATIALML